MKLPKYKIQDDYQTPDWIIELLLPFIPKDVKTLMEGTIFLGNVLHN